MSLIGLDHVQLAAPKGCEEEARSSFGKILGLAEIEKPEALRARGGCWFQIGAQQLHIGVEDPFAPAAKAHPAIAVDDVEELFDCLMAVEISCIWDDAIPGVKRFYAADPWGNRLEFIQP